MLDSLHWKGKDINIQTAIHWIYRMEATRLSSWCSMLQARIRQQQETWRSNMPWKCFSLMGRTSLYIQLAAICAMGAFVQYGINTVLGQYLELKLQFTKANLVLSAFFAWEIDWQPYFGRQSYEEIDRHETKLEICHLVWQFSACWLQIKCKSAQIHMELIMMMLSPCTCWTTGVSWSEVPSCNSK